MVNTCKFTLHILVISALISTVILLCFAHDNPIEADEASSWQTMSSGTENNLWDICAVSPTDVFAVGDGSTIIKYDGANWSLMEPGIDCQLRGVWGNSSSDVFAVGAMNWYSDYNGVILHFDGSSWEPEDIGTIGNLFDIWGTSSSNIFAVGGSSTPSSTMLHYDGNAWTQINIDPKICFRAIWGSSASNIFAVGVSYTPGVANVLHYDGTSWESMDTGTTNGLSGIWGSSSEDVFAVGEHDTILHFDGSSWQSVNVGFNTNFSAVWGTSPTDVYVVGQSGIVHYDGSAWSLVTGSSSYVLYGIGGTEDEIFCVGIYGTVVYSGTKELPALWASPVRKWYERDSVTDFDAAVGESVTHQAFSVLCDPLVTDSTNFAVAHDNSAFAIFQSPPSPASGGTWFFSFSPTQPGITTDNITVSSDVGDISFQLIGNGVPVESPDFWISDLPPGTKAERLLYDSLRDYIYVTDSGSNRVLVFSPEQQSVLTTISVGTTPIDLAMTPDGRRLYVTNSGELSISEINLDTLTEERRLIVPWLGTFPGITPYSITMVSNTVAFVGGDPPGLASGGPIWELDVHNLTIRPRDDIGSGIRPVLRTSDDLSTTVILLEPGSSPTKFVRYDNATGSFVSSSYNNIERDVAINKDGTIMIATMYDSNIYYSDLRLFDRDLNNLKRINLLSYKAFMPVFHPGGEYIYAMNDPTYSVQEVNLNTMTQTRDLRYPIPTGYYMLDHPKGSCVSSDGLWLYALLGQTWNEPPSKLLAIKIDRPLPISTNRATNISIESGTLNGVLNSLEGSSSVNVSFQWGTTLGDYAHFSETSTQVMYTTGSFDFELTGLSPSTTYYYRAKATGDSTFYGEEKCFTTATPTPQPTPVGYRDIPLNQDWNLMGLPLIPADTSIENLLAGIIDNVTIVWGYDNSNPGNPWTSWAPIWGGDLTEMVDCMGYWIKMRSADTLRVYGYSGVLSAGHRDIPLNQDWNLMSLPLVPDDPGIEVVLAGSTGNVTVVWGYDNSNPGNPWTSWAPIWGGDLTDMVDCMGYWVKTTGEGTLTVSGVSGLESDYAFIETTGGSRDVLALSAQQTADGGYIVAGYTSGPPIETPEPLATSTLELAPTPTPVGADDQDVLLLKYDSSGSLSWAKTASVSSEYVIVSVRQTADGGYVLAGYTSSYGYEGRDVLLLKYDSAGVFEWARTTGGSNEDIAHSVRQTADGGYVVAGETRSYGAGQTDILLLKYDSTGTLEWARTAGGGDYDDALSVQQTADGGYVVAGYTRSYGLAYDNVFLLKYDSEGTLSWARTTGGNDEDMAWSVQQTADGGYVVAGWTNSYGAGGRDVLLLKYDSSGTLEWARTAGGSGSDHACSVQQTADGGYIVAGGTVAYHPVPAGGVFLLKYDSAGTLGWARTAGGGSADSACSVQQTTDGGYFVTGSTSSYGAGDVNVFLLKTDREGNIPDCQLVSSASPSVSSPNLIAGPHSVSIGSPLMSTNSPDISTSSLSLTTDTLCTGEGPC